MLKLQMLQNVTPEEYGMDGQKAWREAVQFHKGEVHSFEETLAEAMIENGDAKSLETEGE